MKRVELPFTVESSLVQICRSCTHSLWPRPSKWQLVPCKLHWVEVWARLSHISTWYKSSTTNDLDHWMMHKWHRLGHQGARFPELDQEQFASQRCGDSFEISRGLDRSSCLVERSPSRQRVLLVEQDGWQHQWQICIKIFKSRIQTPFCAYFYPDRYVKRRQEVAEKKGGAGVDDWVKCPRQKRRHTQTCLTGAPTETLPSQPYIHKSVVFTRCFIGAATLRIFENASMKLPLLSWGAFSPLVILRVLLKLLPAELTPAQDVTLLGWALKDSLSAT